jgi:ADP-ribose pyrophosphatase YjhB (NUDIX family)
LPIPILIIVKNTIPIIQVCYNRQMSDKKSKVVKKNQKVFIDQRALIFNDQGKILLVSSEEHGWDLPGGLYKPAATWKESLEQEISRKLNLEIMTEEPFFATDYLDPDSGEVTIMHVIKCRAFTKEFSAKNYAEAEWVMPSMISTFEFSTYDVKDALNQYFSEE